MQLLTFPLGLEQRLTCFTTGLCAYLSALKVFLTVIYHSMVDYRVP